MVTPWGLPIVPIVWVSIVLDEPPTPARTGLLLSMDVYPHISTNSVNELKYKLKSNNKNYFTVLY